MTEVSEAEKIWKFEKSAYTATGISGMLEMHLIDLHNRLARYLGNEERDSFRSRKLLESAVTGMLITANVPGTDKAPKGEKPAKTKPKPSAKADKETTMTAKTKSKTEAKSSKKGSDRRKSKVTKERTARSNFDGKKIKAVSKENPRREGTDRFKLMEIIIKAGAAGITYEDFVKKGGSHGAVQGALNRGYVKVS